MPARPQTASRRRASPRAVPAQPADSRSTALAIALGLAVLVALVYWPVRHFDFTALDDGDYVQNNPYVRAGLAWSSIVWAWTTVFASNWHPLTWMSHMLDVDLFGLDAGGHHMTSVVLHAINAVLLFAVLRRMTGSMWRSSVVAALFAVHPLHVESVAWIAERKDVLSGCFWMLTVWAYASYAERPSAKRYALVAATFALGLAAKPMLVTLPFVLLLLDWWPLGRAAGSAPQGRRDEPWRWLVVEKLPLVVLASASSVVTVLAQQSGGALRGIEIYPLGLRIANALESSVLYIVRMAWPAGLAVFYPFPADVPTSVALACAAVLLALSAAALALARRAPYVPVGWLWYLGTLVPVIGIVQVGSQAHADRYTYLPLIGLFIIVSWGGHWAVNRLLAGPRTASNAGRRATAVMAATLVAGCAIASARQLQYWRDGLSMWQRAADVVPENYRAHGALGLLLKTQPNRKADAMSHLLEAVRLRPDLAPAHSALADLLFEQGRTREAIVHLARVVELNPASASARTRLGQALAADGQTAAAIQALEDAVRLDPRDAQARAALAALKKQPG
jgi:tetratricopeptide (TPR) repeat protein